MSQYCLGLHLSVKLCIEASDMVEGLQETSLRTLSMKNNCKDNGTAWKTTFSRHRKSGSKEDSDVGSLILKQSLKVSTSLMAQSVKNLPAMQETGV